MSNSTASPSSSTDYVILTTQKINGIKVDGTYPIYVRGVSQCCIDKNDYQQITPIVIPVPVTK
jgi:hypothetical protein